MSQFSSLSMSVTKHWARALRLFPVKNAVATFGSDHSHCRNYAKFNPNREPLGNEDASGFKPKDSNSTNSGQSEESGSNSGENVKKKLSITERLMKMSMESAENFEPRERKEPLDDEYRARFRDHPRDNRGRQGFNSNKRSRY